ncbi:glycosyltransferase family 2 protein [Flavivirga rizhaonensis]|uniref:Glycosyltransferase family 2 protein n=1 Tax=Flavivirga rizhaonensis TaxID=2559571 RepID=A0A4S1DVV7_9FLAO|nr:glycosyltransferase family 2 protein [Flavivirga rizhaonensis]TGV02005.1 glycosyltransferase family 2 protein [Flavivirga rizhaonensis]
MDIFEKNIFVVIVSYNGEKWLVKNLESLQQSLFPIKVIVIDNSSSDNTAEIVKSFPDVQLILSKENLGFGKANNLGIKASLEQGADYVFLLNQDTWVYPETFGNLIRVAERNESYGILSPLHFSRDENVLDENFETYWNRKTDTISKNIDEVPFVNAAAWLISKQVIEKVGYFEPMFDHYGEDRNYVDRVRFHGYKIVIVKDAKICHDREISRNFNKDSVQSKYKILGDVLNVNYSIFKGYLKGLQSVFGLPKYFYKYYTLPQILQLFFKLSIYYLVIKVNIFSILKKRGGYKR